jgi:O-antigen/teichoic acid export membrane protein
MARFFGELALVSSFRILAFAVPAFTLAALLAAFTQGFQRMEYKVIAQDIVRPAVEVLGLVVLAWLGARQLGLSIAYTLAVVFSGGLLIYFASLDLRKLARAFPNSPSVPQRTLVRPVLGFALPVWAVNLLVNVRGRATVLMLGVLGTSAMVGVFSVLERLTALGMTMLVSLNFMLGPMVADLVERQQIGELSRLYKLSTRWMLTLSLPFFLILGFFGVEILKLFGPEFVDGSSVLWYLVAAMIFDVATGSCGVILMMSGHPHYSAINEAIMLITVVVLNLLLIPRYELLGAVWAVALGRGLVNVLRVIQVWWHLRIQPYSWSITKVAAASLTMSGVLWGWRTYVLQADSSPPALLLGGMVALLVFGVVVLMLGLEDNEVELLRTLRKRLVPIKLSGG